MFLFRLFILEELWVIREKHLDLVAVVSCVEYVGIGSSFIWVGCTEHCCVVVLCCEAADVFVCVVTKSMTCTALNLASVLEDLASVIAVGFGYG